MNQPNFYTIMAALAFIVAMGACDQKSTSSVENPTAKASEETTPMTTLEKKEKLRNEIAQIEERFFASDPKIRSVYNKELMEQCDTYVRLYASDSLAPDMLFKAGNAAVNALKFEKSQSYYNRIINNYRDYKKTAEVLYMQGFVYESHLNNYGNAKEKYQEIINRFPDHELAIQAQLSIDNLGKTDEEIVKAFQQNK